MRKPNKPTIDVTAEFTRGVTDPVRCNVFGCGENGDFKRNVSRRQTWIHFTNCSAYGRIRGNLAAKVNRSGFWVKRAAGTDHCAVRGDIRCPHCVVYFDALEPLAVLKVSHAIMRTRVFLREID